MLIDGLQHSCSLDFGDREGVEKIALLAFVPLLSGWVVTACRDDNMQVWVQVSLSTVGMKHSGKPDVTVLLLVGQIL